MPSKVFDIIAKEEKRQNENIELIASENFVSDDIKKAVGSCFTNKYCEGYPANRNSGRTGRYYGGCENADELEEYCCDMWRKVFNTSYHVNVQPHSGSQANCAAYFAVLKPGDTILAMSLENGGHLTHGSAVNFSGKLYNVIFYSVDNNGFIDCKDLENKIVGCKPKLILAGASAYSRVIDFEKIYNIIQKVRTTELREYGEDYNPYFMVDMAHIAGLVAAGEHPSPFGYADIITTTTHKTLRGPRGGLIFCKPELAKKIDGAVFPGNQGGPLMHVIAGKAICAEEALTDDYRWYIKNVVHNTWIMATEFIKLGYDVVTGGTDNHLFLLDFSRTHPNITGQMVQDACDANKITLNKNCVPNEKRNPKETSGVRIGCAAMTTKGYDEADFKSVAHKIHEIIEQLSKEINND